MNDRDRNWRKKASLRALLLSTALPATLLTIAASPFTVSSAWADAECGVPGAGGVVVCDNSGAPATNANPYPNGIRYDINAPLVGGVDILSSVDPTVGVNLTATGITIVGNALPVNQGAGISVRSHAASGPVFITGPIVIDVQNSSIRTSAVGTTSAFQVHGIVATSEGPITITVANSDITTTGDGSGGIFAGSNTLGLISIDTTTATITTLGDGSSGITAENVGGGSLAVTAGDIDTVGDGSSGVIAFGSGPTDVTSTGHLISTAGDGSAGIFAQTGAGPLTVTSGEITTQGDDAQGVATANFGSGLTDIDTTAAPITTQGDDATGILANQFGDGPLTITSGRIDTQGANAKGIDAFNTGSGLTDINTTAAPITTAGDGAHGVLAEVSSGPLTIVTGDISTEGANAYGVSAINDGTALTSIDTTGGTITTLGDNSGGVIGRSPSNAPMDIRTADVSTAGLNAAAVSTIGGSSVGIDTTAGTLSTTGNGSAGIFAFSDAPNSEATITSGAITTTGTGAYGIAAAARGLNGSITVTNAGPIVSSGSEGGGIVAVSYASDATGVLVASGTVTVNANANITATGQNAAGITASSDLGPVNVTVANGVSVQGGWSADPADLSTGVSNVENAFIGSNLPAAGIVVFSGEASTITNNGFVGALNDRAITMGSSCAWNAGGGSNPGTRLAPGSIDCADGARTLPPVGSLTLNNNNTIDGYVTFWDGAPHTVNNAGLFNVRNFADTNGDGVRDIEAVSVSDFGAGSTFNNLAGGLVKIAAVTAPTVDTTGQYLPTTGTDNRGLESSFYSIDRAGVSQGQFVNLQTFSNAGTIDLSGPAVGNTLVMTSNPTVGGAPGNGVFVSNGGTLLLNTVLNDGIPVGGQTNSYSDMLIVDSTQLGSAPTSITVTNQGGLGALTPGNGIELVEVRNKAASAGGVFALNGDYQTTDGQQAVIGGAYAYTLFHNGVGGDAADGNWYLRSTIAVPPVEPPVVPPVEPPASPRYQPGVPLYEAYPQTLLGLNNVPTLQQRVGNRYWKEAAPREPETVFCKDASKNFKCAVTDEQAQYYAGQGGYTITMDQAGIWGRIEGSHGHFEPAVTTSSTDYDLNTWRLQAGLDAQLLENKSGKLFGGINLTYGSASADVDSFFGKGDIDTTGYGVGATLTWYGNNGFYVDGQAQVMWYDSDIFSKTLDIVETKGNDGLGYALSLEAGKRIELTPNWTLTPQAQLVYSKVSFDKFTDAYGAEVSLDDGDSLKGRVGIAAEYTESWKDDNGQTRRAAVYGIANLTNEFLDGTQVDVSGAKFKSRNDRLWGGVGIGGSYNWADDKYSVFGEVAANTALKDFGDSYTVNGTIGLKVKW